MEVGTAIDELPEDITVVVNDASKLEPLRNLPDIISHVSALFTMIAALLVVFLILIHLLLLQSSLRAGGLFAGTFMFVTGITCFIVKAIIISATSSAVNNADLPSPLTAEVVNRLISDSLAQTTIWAVVFTLLGIAAIAASIFLLKGEKPDNTYSPY